MPKEKQYQQSQQYEGVSSAPVATFLTALASVKLLRETSVIDLTEEDYEYLISSKLWLPIDRSRARRCVEAVVYGGLDYVGFPRFPPPVEFIAAAIALFVHPQNIQVACLIMEGMEFTDNVIQGVERPVRAQELFAIVLHIRAHETFRVDNREASLRESLSLKSS